MCISLISVSIYKAPAPNHLLVLTCLLTWFASTIPVSVRLILGISLIFLEHSRVISCGWKRIEQALTEEPFNNAVIFINDLYQNDRPMRRLIAAKELMHVFDEAESQTRNEGHFRILISEIGSVPLLDRHVSCVSSRPCSSLEGDCIACSSLASSAIQSSVGREDSAIS